VTRAVAACLVFVLAAVAPAGTQPSRCTRPLEVTTVSGDGYVVLDVRAFEGRVFAYLPAVSGSGSSFRPFSLWVVEGVYGKPFVRTSGSLTPAAFDKLRDSRNVRATAIRVSRGDGSEGTTLRVGKDRYRVEAQSVNASGRGTARVAVCQ